MVFVFETIQYENTSIKFKNTLKNALYKVLAR